MHIAFIGCGVMGVPMAGHLLNAGHTLHIFTRTADRAAALIQRGAVWCDTPAAAASGQDIAISMVGYPDDVEAVHLGDRGTLSAVAPPRVILDMTTSEPALAERIAAQARQRGVGAVDAPVSGGDVGARNATLSIMVGGEEADVAMVMPVLEVLGKTIVHHGPPGSGQHAKMVNQVLIATNMIGVCEGLLYAERAGLDPIRVIESVGSGAAGSWSINNLGPRIIEGEFGPGFYIEHFLKDLRIAMTEAKRMNLDLPGLALAIELYERAEQQDMQRDGTQALMKVLRAMNTDP